ncbi:MAG: hypothetical protein P4L64_02635, partial [Caulobacteraceae bacterium]|nr:hypothetical protein [Caulobacteraceae bacterium]
RVRWRIAPGPSAPMAFDAAAPGAARMRAELVRRRSGPPGAWDLEWNDEAGGLRVVAGLAGHGLATRDADADSHFDRGLDPGLDRGRPGAANAA